MRTLIRKERGRYPVARQLWERRGLYTHQSPSAQGFFEMPVFSYVEPYSRGVIIAFTLGQGLKERSEVELCRLAIQIEEFS